MKPFNVFNEFLAHLDQKAERGEYAATAATAAEIIRELLGEQERHLSERDRAEALYQRALADLGRLHLLVPLVEELWSQRYEIDLDALPLPDGWYCAASVELGTLAQAQALTVGVTEPGVLAERDGLRKGVETAVRYLERRAWDGDVAARRLQKLLDDPTTPIALDPDPPYPDLPGFVWDAEERQYSCDREVWWIYFVDDEENTGWVLGCQGAGAWVSGPADDPHDLIRGDKPMEVANGKE